MKQTSCTIRSNKTVADGFFLMEFEWGRDLLEPHPGQFFTVRVTDGSSPLLRRPFAFSGYDRDSGAASFIYQKRGRATELLSAKSAGEPLDLIGPLGNHFFEPPAGSKAVIVAGGIGLGPMLFLARSLQVSKRDFLFIFGSRTRASVPQDPAFLSLRPHICTDDGTCGFCGTTAGYLETIGSGIARSDLLYACGPMPMLKACHQFSQERGCQSWVCVEQVMACGVGACMGCVIKVNYGSGFARVCADGPVFDSREIAWS